MGVEEGVGMGVKVRVGAGVSWMGVKVGAGVGVRVDWVQALSSSVTIRTIQETWNGAILVRVEQAVFGLRARRVILAFDCDVFLCEYLIHSLLSFQLVSGNPKLS
jgi:hypothetical protein